MAALLFANEGSSIVVASRRVEPREEIVRMIKEKRVEATFISTDISKGEEVENMVRTAARTYGKLDILYNNAAVIHKPAPIVEVTLEDWQRTITINLTGTLLCMKYAIPEMLKTGGGVIINTASIAALEGVPGHGGYSASKGGILSLSRGPGRVRVKGGES
jgi:NAD(P)-dependent dehydrogenase (short-subunit alcohol dehydrogenase family)